MMPSLIDMGYDIQWTPVNRDNSLIGTTPQEQIFSTEANTKKILLIGTNSA